MHPLFEVLADDVGVTGEAIEQDLEVLASSFNSNVDRFAGHVHLVRTADRLRLVTP
jgi:hypothetical protein